MRDLLYAVLAEPRVDPPGLPSGPGGHPVVIRREGGLAVALSRFDGPPPGTGQAEVTAFFEVVLALHRAATILPMRYGNLIEDNRVAGFLRSRNEEFRATLEALDGCEEMSVRVVCTAGNTPELPRGLVPEPLLATPGRAWLLERRSVERRREQIRGHLVEGGNRVRRALEDLSVDAILEEPAPSRRGAGGDTLSVAVHLLVRREHVAELQGRFASVRAPKGFTCSLSGPWPPFAFSARHLNDGRAGATPGREAPLR